MRAILFDFGGTLDQPSHWLDRFLANYRAAGAELTREELDPAFTHATRTAYGVRETVRNYGFDDLVRFLAGLQFDYLAKAPGSTKGRLGYATAAERTLLIRKVVAGFVAESRAGLLKSRALLKDLSSRYKIGIVSNFYGNLDRVLAEAGLEEFVSAIADSMQLGMSKPDDGIFEYALAALGVAPGATAMVGDSLDKDCAPAHRLGMTPIWLCHQTADIDADAGKIARYKIRSLEELRELQW